VPGGPGTEKVTGVWAVDEKQILAWADAYFERYDAWPHARSGTIDQDPHETWFGIDYALRFGRRGLPGGSSLTLLLAEKRAARNPWSRPQLTIKEILAWADAFHERTGRWPQAQSGPIPEARGETWCAVHDALRNGLRGLTEGVSFAQLLSRERGKVNRATRPGYTLAGILKWADEYFGRMGSWPGQKSGPIPEAPGETWSAVDEALLHGLRGLRGGSSLAKLLQAKRGKWNRKNLPRLSIKKILVWADAHFQGTGKWPNVNSGKVAEAPSENWRAINDALTQGTRGFAGRSSLLRVLVRKRGVRDLRNQPPLTEQQIMEWAEQHRQRTGRWPKYKDGPIPNGGGETWSAVDNVLRLGKRGLPGGSSLAKLLAKAIRNPEMFNN
jgi:hypothetical protein